MTEVKGSEVLIKKTPYEIYALATDLKNFAAAIPSDKMDDIKADEDSMRFKIQGFELGLQISEKVPYSLVSYSEIGSSPFPFKFNIHLQPVGFDSTLFHIELFAELNTMMKMIIGNRLQSMVDQLTEQIEQAVNSGQMPDFPNISEF